MSWEAAWSAATRDELSRAVLTAVYQHLDPHDDLARELRFLGAANGLRDACDLMRAHGVSQARDHPEWGSIEFQPHANISCFFDAISTSDQSVRLRYSMEYISFQYNNDTDRLEIYTQYVDSETLRMINMLASNSNELGNREQSQDVSMEEVNRHQNRNPADEDIIMEDENEHQMQTRNGESNINLAPMMVVERPEQGNQSPAEQLWCICRSPDDGRRMIFCDGEDCRIGWYHFECISMRPRDVPSGAWICRECEQDI